jgi:hypothetical protein
MTDAIDLGPFEILGLLGNVDRGTVERRGEALAAMLRLGLSPPDGDAVKLDGRVARTPETVTEAVRRLRDPQTWLRETLLWPDGGSGTSALKSAADLLDGATGRGNEPAALVRQLAHQYLADELNRHGDTDQPDRWLEHRFDPPAKPPLYLEASAVARDEGTANDPPHD